MIDRLVCKGRHSVERFWHFSEECIVEPLENGVVARNGERKIFLRRNPDGRTKQRIFHGDEEGMLGWISRRYDVKVPATTVVWMDEIQGTTELSMEIHCPFECSIKE